MGMAVRVLVVEYGESVAWLGFLRFGIGALAMLVPALGGAWSLRVRNRPIFVLRGVIGATGMALLYLAIAEVGLGRGTVLVYLMSVVAAVTGIVVLGERLGAQLVLAVGLSSLGVVLLAEGGLPRGAEWLALAGALCSGVTLVLIRLLRRTDSDHVVFFSQGLCGTLVLLPFVVGTPMPVAAASWLVIAGMIAADIVGQLCMSAGLARTPVAQGGALLTLTPLFSLAIGFMYFAEPLSVWQWTGSAIVLAASLVALLHRPAPASPPTTGPIPGVI